MPSKIPVKRALPIIRVFVSSTFSDLIHERNALHAQVWPELERYCQQRGFTFQAIDLRWGVPAEAGLDHRTMRICFEELRRSQETSPEPNFLILLGNRYGWRPLPEVISVAEFEKLKTVAQQIQSELPDPAKQHSNEQVAILKKAVAVLEDWYLLDENAKPFDDKTLLGEYVLRTRKTLLRGVDYGRQPDTDGKLRDTAAWVDVQFVLWSIVNRAFPATGLGDRFGPNKKNHDQPIVRFQASATEQEIWQGALRSDNPNAKQHVIAWFREIENLSECPPGPQFKDFVDLREDGTPDQGSKQALEKLTSELKETLDAENVFAGKCRWNVSKQGPSIPDVTTDHLNAMCKQIRERLQAMIILQINAYWGCDLSADNATLAQVRGSQQELDLECADHLRFAGERAPEKTFVGRESEQQRIRDYLHSKTNQPFVVHGPSGSGKTALLGKIIQEVTPPRSADGTRAKTGPVVLSRFIGTTPESSNLRSLMSSLCRELRQDFEMTTPLPTDPNELIAEFYSQLGKATVARPVFVFLDALDQLDAADHGRSVFWIRSPLSSTADTSCHARMVVSCLAPSDEFTEDSKACEPFRELRLRKLLGSHELGALDENDARQLFARWLNGAGRSVSETQQSMIWSAVQTSSACRQPLFLKVLFEEARRWRSFDAPSAIPESLAQLLDELFIRLGQPSEHGELIGIALSCLVSARYGLSEGELLEILFTDPEYKAILAEGNRRNGHELLPESTRIPIAPWTRLRSDLAPYLAERSAPGTAVMHFYHRQVEQAVRKRYLRTPDLKTSRHRQLADYVNAQDYWLESVEDQQRRAKTLPPTPRPANVRKVDELPWQLLKAADWQRSEQLLTELPFLEAKAEAGMVFDLAADFSAAIGGMPADRPLLRILRLLEEALRRDIHFIARHPTTFFQCMWNSCWWYDCAEAARRYLPPEGGWSALGPPWERSGLKLADILKRWRASLNPGRCWVCSLRPPTRPLGGGVRAVFVGHEKKVGPVAFSPDGNRIATGSEDGTIRLWNSVTCEEVGCLRGHEGTITGLAYSPDGKRLASSGDRTIRLWDALAGTELLCIRGHDHDVLRVAFSPDGRRLVSGAQDFTVRLWDAGTGAQLACLKGHENSRQMVSFDNLPREHRYGVFGVAFSPDGKKIASGAGDTTVRIWDIDQGKEIACFRGHRSAVNAVAFSPDGRLVASGSGGCNFGLFLDGSLRLWEADSGKQLLYIRHDGGKLCDVPSVAFSPDGRRLLSASNTGTIRIWDVADGRPLGAFVDYERGWSAQTEGGRSAAFSPDGRWIVSGASDGSVRIFDAGRDAQPPRLPDQGSWPAAFSPDGAKLFSASDTWDARDGRHLASRPVPSSSPYFSPDARRMACTDSLSIRILDTVTGDLLAFLTGMRWMATTQVFSPDGQRLLVPSGDHLVRIFDTDSGKEVVRLRGHQAGVVSAAWSPDGLRVVSAANDDPVFVWDALTGRRLARLLVGPECHVHGVRFSLDGRQILLFSKEGNRAWDALSFTSCAFVPDEDPPERAWTLLEGKRESTAIGPDGTVRAWFRPLGDIQYQPGGNSIAGTFEGVVQLVTIMGRTEEPAPHPRTLALAGEPILTPVFRYRHDLDRFEDQTTVQCPACDQFFEAGAGPSSCPHCGLRVRCNSFVVDDRGTVRQPIEDPDPPRDSTSEFADNAEERVENFRKMQLGERAHSLIHLDPDHRFDEYAMKDCMEAFAKRLYTDCIKKAEGLLAQFPMQHLEHLILLSLLRQGRGQEAERRGDAFRQRALAQKDAWGEKLLRVTLGQTDPLEIFRTAGDEEQVCQAAYYGGARFLTLGKFESARVAFVTACLMRWDCWEARLGGMEHEALPQRTADNATDAAARRKGLNWALAQYEAQERVSRELEIRDNLWRALGNKGFALLRLGEMDKALRCHKEQETICRELGEPAGMAQALDDQAEVLVARGDLPSALEVLGRAEAAWRELGRGEELHQCKARQAEVLSTLGRSDEAAAILGGDEEVGDPRQRLVEQIQECHLRGDAASTLEKVNALEKLCRKMQDESGIAYCLGLRGASLVSQGQMAEGLGLLQQQEAIVRKSGDEKKLMYCLLVQAQAYDKMGWSGEAVKRFEDLMPLVTEVGDPEVTAYFLQSHAARLLDGFDAPLEAARQAGDAFRYALDANLVEAASAAESTLQSALLEVAKRSLHTSDDRAEAIARAENALEIAREHGQPNIADSLGKVCDLLRRRSESPSSPHPLPANFLDSAPQLQSQKSAKCSWRDRLRILAGFLVCLTICGGGTACTVAWSWGWLAGVPLVLIGAMFLVATTMSYAGLITVVLCPRCNTKCLRWRDAQVFCSNCGAVAFERGS